MHFIVIWLTLLVITQGSTGLFSNRFPSEILTDEILNAGWLTLDDHIQSTRTLNNKARNIFKKTYYNFTKDIQLINNLSRIVHSHHILQLFDSFDLQQISKITKQLQLNELFYSSYFYPLVRSLDWWSQNGTIVQRIVRRNILVAMNLKPIDFSDIQIILQPKEKGGVGSFKLALLIWTSRRLLGTLGTWHDNMPAKRDMMIYCDVYEVIFDYFHQELNLPSLDQIYLNNAINTTNQQQRANLLVLVKEDDFIPWNREMIKDMRDRAIEKKNALWFRKEILEKQLKRFERLSEWRNLDVDFSRYKHELDAVMMYLRPKHAKMFEISFLNRGGVTYVGGVIYRNLSLN